MDRFDIVEFPAVIGQKDVKVLLRKAVLHDRMAHAYLFSGPSGTGRLAMALEMARILNCRKGYEASITDLCECASCKNIRRWQHPNLFPIFPLPPLDKNKGVDAEVSYMEIIAVLSIDPYSPVTHSGSGRILIDQIRELRNRLSLASDRSGVRTLIIEPADRMTMESANAILKLLEEPPDNCCLILVTESTRTLLPTIVSRCQKIVFPPLTPTDIADTLMERKGCDREKAEQVANISAGSYVRATSLLEGNVLEQLETGLEYLRAAAMDNALNIIDIIEALPRGVTRQSIKELLAITSLWLKDALVLQSGALDQTRQYLSIPHKEEVIVKMAAKYNSGQLADALNCIEEAILAIDSYVNLPMLLTALALKIQRALR